MLNSTMENAEEIFHFLDDFSKRKPKTIPQELNEYLAYVARTGDPVYQWSLVKSLFKEKLLNVMTDFYETTPGIEIPPYPNVDPFNYDTMKNSLLERLDSFTSAPFTVQRLCELLTFPRKQYNRIDKFMRAIEKNILVVSTREPGIQRHSEAENGETEPVVNGSDSNSEYHVDVEMEDATRKESNEQWNEPQPGSSDTHISVDDIEARLKAKENMPIDSQEKITAEYESVTPPELNVTSDDSAEMKPEEIFTKLDPEVEEDKVKEETSNEPEVLATTDTLPSADEKKDVEMQSECASTLVIPEIRVDDAEMTEQKLIEQANTDKQMETSPLPESKVSESVEEAPQVIDESSSDSKDGTETKLISEVSTSSEESSSSSDNTDGNSNSPKTDEGHIVDIQEESSHSDSTIQEESSHSDSTIQEESSQPEANILEESQPDTNVQDETQPEAEPEALKEPDTSEKPASPAKPKEDLGATTKIECEKYSISDVQSELPPEEIKENAENEEPLMTEEKPSIEEKPEVSEGDQKDS